MGHQLSFTKIKSKFRFCHGGILRRFRAGRRIRPLSSKESIHLVFKARKSVLKQKSLRSPKTYVIAQKVIQRYAKRFFVKIEQISIQNDHIHLLIRCSRRSLFHYFFRVVAGQIAQTLQKKDLLSIPVTGTPSAGTKLWIYRPFTRVVRSYRAYRIAVAYIKLNELEANETIRYRKERLKGLSAGEWHIFWV